MTDEAYEAWRARTAAVYDQIPGGAKLMDWYGNVPSFHDAEIVALNLAATGISELKFRYWPRRRDGWGHDIEGERLITFALNEVLDLELEDFSPQNVIGEMNIQRAPSPPDRKGLYADTVQLPDDVEIELTNIYGLNGRIRCRGILSISIELMPKARKQKAGTRPAS